MGIHWLTLHVNGDNVKYLDSFGVEYISKEINEPKKILQQIFI